MRDFTKISRIFKGILLMFLLITSSSYGTTYYSRANTNWTVASTWSTTCGGSAASSAPTASDDVIICAGNTVIMNAAGTCRSLTIQGTANWTGTATIAVGVGGLNINSGGDITGTTNGIVTTTGGLIINATLTSATVTIRTITVAGQTISGTGTLAKLDISAATTNNGTITVTSTITSTVASTLTQGSTGSLTYNGTTLTPTLDASASGNTVIYGGTTQTVKSATYHHLTISGSGAKTLGGAITVNGDFSINSGTLATSTFQITGNTIGSFSMAASTGLYIGLNSSTTDVVFPTNFTNNHISLSSTSTVYYYGNYAQTVSSVPTYGNLNVITFAGAKTANGDLNVTGNLTTTASTLTMTTYTLNLTGNYLSTGALSFTTGTFNISGNFTNTGTFTKGTGTVNYNGSSAQTVRGVNYNNLTFSSTGDKLLQAAATVGISGTFTRGTMIVTPGATNTVTFNGGVQTMTGSATSFTNLTFSNTSLSAPADFTVSSTLTTTSPAALNMSTYTLNVSGSYAGAGSIAFTSGTFNLTGNYTGTGALSFTTGAFNISGSFTNTGTFTCGTGTVDYNGGGAQTVRGVNYNNLTFSGVGAKTLQASATIGIAGTFTRGSMTVTPGTSNTVTFNGGAQTMTGSATTFTNLTFANTSLTAPADFTISGTLTTTSPATLNMTSYTLAVTGSYAGTGALTFTSGTFNLTGAYSNTGTFTCGTSTVNYCGASQTVRGGTNYYNLTFSGSGTKTLQAATTIGIAGTFTRGTLTVRAGATNTVLFNGGAQVMTGNATTFTNLTINNTSLTIPADITIGTTLTFTAGTIITGSSNVIANGSVSRTSGHVVGNLRKSLATGSNITKTFEIGTGSDYVPLTLLFASVTTAGSITTSSTVGDHPSVASSGFNTSKTVNRYWTITNTTAVYTNYTLTATFVSGDLDGGYNTNNSLIKLYNGTTWALTNAGTATSTTAQALTVATPVTPNTVYAQIGEIIGSSTGDLYSIATAGWSTAGTWSTTSGGASCGCIPTSLDNVYIENNFTVTMDGNSGAAKSLTIQTGGKATWTSALTTNVGSGGVNIASTGDITGTGAGILTTTGGLTLNKVLTSTTVTIKTASVSGQTISGTGTVGKLDISAATTNNGNITVSSTLTSTVASTLTLGASSTLTYNGTSAITSTIDGSVSGSTFIYGGAAQTVKSATYHHLIISGSGTKTLGGAISINGNLSVNVGILSTSTFQITGNASGTFTMAASTNLYVGAAASATNVLFPTGFTNANISLSSTSNVVYLGNNAQTVSYIPTYGILTIQTYSGSKVADGNITLTGGLVTTSPSILNMGSYNLTVGGTYTGTGALSYTSGAFNLAGTYTNTGSFTCGTGTVTYNGSGAQTVRGVNYNNLTFSGTGAKTLQAASTVGIAGTFTRGTMTVTAGATNTVLFNGGVQSMTGNATTFVNLTINNTSITIPANITVGTTLTFTAGNIITGSNNVIIPSTTTVNRTSGHVVGNMRKAVATGSSISKTFEVGTSTDYTPLVLVYSVVSVAGNFTVSTTASDHASILTSGFNPSYTINRYWTVTNATTVYTNYTATATFVNGDKDPGYTPANSIIKIYNGSSWSTPTAGSPTANTAVAQTITTPTTPNTVYLQIGDSNPNITGNLYSIASGNWSATSTWSQTSGGSTCYCTPTSINDVVIESNKTVTMDGNPGVAKSLTVQTGGIATWTSALTTNIGTSGVNIASTGDITGSSVGVLTTSGGLTLNKALTSTSVIIKTITTAGQTIAGTGTLANLDINVNTTNNGNITLTDVLTITDGYLTNSGTFTLKATASKYARIAPISCSSCGFIGNFVIQNYLPARSSAVWANLAAPVVSSTMADWDNELFMEYPFTGFDYLLYRPTGSNVLAYDEPSASYTECSAATTIAAGKGFEIGLTNDNNATSFSATTLTTVGTPYTGSLNLPLSFTAANGPGYPTGYSGENLVGNPYASAITVNGINFTNTSSYVDVYDYATNNYKTLSGTDIIGPHQGFWVYAQNTGASISMTESSKSTNTTTSVHKTATNTSPMSLTLSSADGSHEMAHTLKLICDANSSDGWDEKDHPFRKSLNPKAPSLTAFNNNVALSIDAFNNSHETYQLLLNANIGVNGQYQINASDVKSMTDEFSVILLVDKLTHKIIDLISSQNYTFTGRTTDPKDRFEVHFAKSAGYTPFMIEKGNDLTTQVNITKSTVGNFINFNMSETENMNISVVDLLGRNLIENMDIEANNQSIEITLPVDFHGTYMVIIQSASGKSVKKFIQF